MLKILLEKIFKVSFPFRNQELPAFLMHNLFHGGSYLPYTISSLRLRPMSCVLNDIVINSRLQILELGAGISTIMMARLAKHNGISLNIFSVDQNEQWIKFLASIIHKEELSQFVNFIHAPLVESTEFPAAYEFNSTIVYSAIDKLKFDLILIDGPTASRKLNRMSRATNYRYLENFLSANASIFIDNTDREGEKLLVEKVKNIMKLKETKLDQSFSIFVKGQHFNFRI